MINVLHINRVGFLGGVERVILNLILNSEKHGYLVTVACPGQGDFADLAKARGARVEVLSVSHIRGTFNPLKYLKYIVELLLQLYSIEKIALSSKTDVIHVHHPVGAFFALRARRKHKIPVILHVHEVLPASFLYRVLFKLIIGDIDHIICVSAAGKELVDRLSPSILIPLQIIHNCVDDKLFYEAPLPSPDVKGLGPHIGVFGVLEPRKGQDIFLQAAQKVLSVFPEANFWIVGAASGKHNIEYEVKLRGMASRTPLQGHVVFAGFRRDVHELMVAMNVVVSASVRHESLSMSIIESLVLGCHSVATKVGGVTEIIEDGVNGWLVEPGDPDRLSSRILCVLQMDKSQSSNINIEISRKHFAPEIYRDKFSQIYDSLLEPSQP